MKKSLIVPFLFYSSFLLGQHDNHGNKTSVNDSSKKSIPKEEHVQIGKAHMMMYYHSPAVRGRIIWGGLVPFGEVWVTGAHSATTLEFDEPLVIDDKIIPAGKYAFFTIPGKEKWTVILNKKWKQHLADEYDSKEDVIRVSVTPTQLKSVQERLVYSIEAKSENEGVLQMTWEKLRIKLPFQIAK